LSDIPSRWICFGIENIRTITSPDSKSQQDLFANQSDRNKLLLMFPARIFRGKADVARLSCKTFFSDEASFTLKEPTVSGIENSSSVHRGKANRRAALNPADSARPLDSIRQR